VNSLVSQRLGVGFIAAIAVASAIATLFWWNSFSEKHLRVVEPGRLIRGVVANLRGVTTHYRFASGSRRS